MRRPYIGVTGFISADEVNTALRCVPAESGRDLMVGVLAGSAALTQEDHPPKGRYTERSKIATLFQEHPRALNLIHYHTRERDSLYAQLQVMTHYGGAHVHGFQLNIAWPPIDALEKFRRNYPGMRIVLQIGRTALRKIQDRVDAVAARILEYQGLVDDVLFDSSGGVGRWIVPESYERYIDALLAKDATIGIGIAGGLCRETLHHVRVFGLRYPQLSIDAEGRLRDDEDRLDPEAMTHYLVAAFNMFDAPGLQG